MKEELFGGLFGTESSLSTAEFQQIFAETGLDLDDRLGSFNKKGKSMEETIAQYVNFAKLVPGFKSLNPKDVAKLLKGTYNRSSLVFQIPDYLLSVVQIKHDNRTKVLKVQVLVLPFTGFT